MARKAKPKEIPAAVLISPSNMATLIPQGSNLYKKLETAAFAMGAFGGGFFTSSRRRAADADSPYRKKGRRTAYQQMVSPGSYSARELLVPSEYDFDAILDRLDLYRKVFPWLNRGLRLWAQVNATEFSADAPGHSEQTAWMKELKDDLYFTTFMQEFFWQLKAHNQVVVLWKTDPEGRKPLSIECADLRIHQPRGPGTHPKIIVLPHKDERLAKLVAEARINKAEAKGALAQYPAPLVEAAKQGGKVEVPEDDLTRYGYHFEYAAIDRRHYEDWAFPGVYSIFPDLEIVGIAQDADINALHHYKVGFVLVRLGPQNPSGTDIPVIATEKQLEDLNKVLMEQARNKLPTLVGRGDLRIDWVVPPADILAPTKYESAQRRIFDWLGIPRIAWPGQDFQGAFAAAQTTLKFIQQESKSEREVAAELFRRWFYERAKASNKFKGVVRPVIRFDPNALMEPRLILEWARFFGQFGGASEQTILEMADLDVEVEAARREQLKDIKDAYGIDFAPEYVPIRAPQLPGRPPTVSQPTPEGEGLRQTRPSKMEGNVEES